MGVGKELDTKPLGGASDRVESLWRQGTESSLHQMQSLQKPVMSICLRLLQYAVATADGHRRAWSEQGCKDRDWRPKTEPVPAWSAAVLAGGPGRGTWCFTNALQGTF